MLFASNLIVGIKYKLYTKKECWHIAFGLILLDSTRIISVMLLLILKSTFYKSELAIRLTHDVPFFFFDCVSVALWFMLMQTLQVLQDADKAVENMKQHKEVEFGILFFLLILFLFDLICLSVD